MIAKEYIENYYKIRTKDGELVNFKFNSAQEELYKTIANDYGNKPCRYIVLKARQLGVSTFTESLITYLTTSQFNTDSVIIAQDRNAASNIYQMTQTFIKELPDILRPKMKYSNTKQLTFDSDDSLGLKSSVKVAVANDSTRSQTYRYAHLSELAFWRNPEVAMTSVLQCVPPSNDSIIVIESTANGFNFFYDLWQKSVRGENDFTPIFFPWYLEKGYRKKVSGKLKLSPYEKEIKERFNLDDEQIEWRRWCIANNCYGDEEKFRQEYPITPEEAFITSGNSVFDTQIILNRLKELTIQGERGYFEYKYDGLKISDIRFVKDDKGYITIYDEVPKVTLNDKILCDYTVIGADTAGDGSDYFAAHVLDRQGRQLATLHQDMDEDLFTKQLYCLGIYFNSLIAVESNFSSYPIREIQRLGYTNMYVRETYDNALKTYQKRYGFRTTSVSRPLIIANLVELFREEIYKINDRSTLNEALSFVKINGKPQASSGTHDDLIMALAIAYEALSQIPSHKTNKEYYDDDYDFINYGV